MDAVRQPPLSNNNIRGLAAAFFVFVGLLSDRKVEPQPCARRDESFPLSCKVENESISRGQRHTTSPTSGVTSRCWAYLAEDVPPLST